MGTGLGNSNYGGARYGYGVQGKTFSHSSYEWKQLAKRVRAEEDYCYLCGYEVDKSLPRYHPYSGQAEHVLCAKDHPELAYERTNVRLAHRICNLRKGTSNPAFTRTSKQWLA